MIHGSATDRIQLLAAAETVKQLSWSHDRALMLMSEGTMKNTLLERATINFAIVCTREPARSMCHDYFTSGRKQGTTAE